MKRFLLLSLLTTIPATAQTPHWSFQSPTGQFDRATLKRGYEVYDQVCATCHGMKALTFAELSGIGLSEDDIRKTAATKQIPDGTDAGGQPKTRAATPDDHLPSPFPSDEAATQALGAAPPDQSHLAQTYEDGPTRIYAYLTSYGQTPPPGLKIPPGRFYNPIDGAKITAMPPVLTDDATTYSDGTKATTAQQARDVTTFLAWAADPHLNQRHHIGEAAILYLLALIVLATLTKHQIWRKRP